MNMHLYDMIYIYIHIYIYIYRREKLWFFFGGLPQTLFQINPSSLPLNLVTFDFAGRYCWLFDLSVEVTLIDLLQPHHLMLGMGLLSGAVHFERLPSRELTYPHLGKRKIIFKMPLLMGYVSSQEGHFFCWSL